MAQKKFMLCLWGRMGSGKTYVAKKVQEKLKQYNPQIMTTSLFLKEEFESLTKMYINSLSFPDAIPYMKPYIDRYIDFKLAGFTSQASLMQRIILQRYGTEFPIIHDNLKIWTTKLSDLINSQYDLKFVINDGCRFPIEIENFKNHGIETAHIFINVNDKTVEDTFNERYPNTEPYYKEMTINHFSDTAFKGWHKLNDYAQFKKYDGRLTDYEIDEVAKFAEDSFMGVLHGR